MHNTNYHGPVSTNWCMWKSKTNSATEEHCTICLHIARCFYPTFIWLMSYLYSASGWSLLFWLWGWQKWLWILFKFFCLGSETRDWTWSWFFGVLTIGLASVSCFGFRLSSYGNHLYFCWLCLQYFYFGVYRTKNMNCNLLTTVPLIAWVAW